MRLPRPCRAVRAGMVTRSRRIVAVRAFRMPAGEGAGGAQQLCAIAAMTSQAAFAAKTPDGRWARGPLVTVGEDLLHDGVVAVLPLGLDQPERRAGEHGVVTPGGERLVHPLGGSCCGRGPAGRSAGP